MKTKLIRNLLLLAVLALPLAAWPPLPECGPCFAEPSNSAAAVTLVP